MKLHAATGPTAFLLLALAAVSSAVAFESRWRVSDADLISIRSAEAWEDERPDVVHFAGGFTLDAGSWTLEADKATVYGPLDRPETVVLDGAPARIWLKTERDNRQQTITGEAPSIEYRRVEHAIRLSGGASLSRADSVMTSEVIDYDIESDRFSAGGPEGVQLRVNTEDAPP
jgi:lipopolysaccharide transport protein LptA